MGGDGGYASLAPLLPLTSKKLLLRFGAIGLGIIAVGHGAVSLYDDLTAQESIGGLIDSWPELQLPTVTVLPNGSLELDGDTIVEQLESASETTAEINSRVNAGDISQDEGDYLRRWYRYGAHRI